jgi:hypothetical protein
MAEGRVNPRVPYEEDVRVLLPRSVPARAIDLGAGGIGIDCPEPIAAGTDVQLVIFQGHAITYGSVRWMRPEGSRFRIGIQFREEDWNIIELVNSLRAQEG